MDFAQHLRARLAELRAAGLHRSLLTLDRATGPVLEVQGRTVIHLASNDYLGLAAHPQLAQAVAAGARDAGAGAGASRLVTGHLTVHAAAEDALARFVGADTSLLFPTGYMANLGAVQGLVGRGDLVVSDALNHASLIDGCRLSGATVLVYPHRDVEAARALLRSHRDQHRAALLVTDSVFSMDATAAPLRALRALTLEHRTGLMVDEAHALGVLGPQGRGLCAQLEVMPDVLVGTLGKSFGLMGAFVAGSEELVDLLRNRARSFVFATALSPAIAAAIPTSVELVAGADARRRQLLGAAQALTEGLRAKGYDVRADTGPILPLWIGPSDRAVELAETLWSRGVLARAIRPPTVPPGTARLRLVPSAETTAAHVATALEAFPDPARPA